jgi:hypothetical protein
MISSTDKNEQQVVGSNESTLITQHQGNDALAQPKSPNNDYDDTNVDLVADGFPNLGQLNGAIDSESEDYVQIRSVPDFQPRGY